jgi:hypothetical protein
VCKDGVTIDFMTNKLLKFEGAAVLPSDFFLNGGTHRPDLWEECFSKLQGFRDLEDDWDGLSAKAPCEAVIRGATELAEDLRRQGWQAPARVISGVMGTVLFEWQKDGLFVEMEVTAESNAEVLVGGGE